MMIKQTKRKHVSLSFASALLLSILSLSGGRISALQQSRTFSQFDDHTGFFRDPTARLWSSGIAETSDFSSEDHQSQQVAYDWDEQFEELQSFMSEYSHCNFPQNPSKQLKKKYPMLKRFCHDQRIEYKLLQDRKRRRFRPMTLAVFDRAVRCRRLEELGFEFSFKSAPWYDRYHELIQYVNENGHFRVAERDNRVLHRWVIDQRCRRNDEAESYTRLSESQIKLLDDIGFEWKLNDETWNSNYEELVAFRNKHGHLVVEYGGPLYDWMVSQRRRRAGKKGTAALTDEQIRLLDEIGFPWKPERYDAKWYTQYDDLQRFQKEHGHCQPHYSTHMRLYNWCREQRNKYDNDSLSKEQIKLLDKIDFPWDGNKRKTWNYKYIELCEFCNEHGHLGVSQDAHPDLHEWMTTQRHRYHGIVGRAMPDGQIEKLEELHFSWSIDWRDRTWHEKYTEAVEFFKERGHVVVTEKENRSLFNWIETQGKRYKEVKGQRPLSDEELELLEQLDFPFLEGQPRMAWTAMYAEVERYRKEHDGRFPTSHKDDRDLSRWIRHQRRRYRCAFGYVPLSDEEKSLLDNIDFPMYPEGKQNRSWYEKFDELCEFQKEHGNFLVNKSDNLSLFKWIEYQRVRFNGKRSPPLSRLQIYLLERIGFPWASDRFEIEWQEMYEELVAFGKEHGHLRVRKSEYPELFFWFKNQRSRIKGHQGYSELPQDQIEQLERIGFQW